MGASMTGVSMGLEFSQLHVVSDLHIGGDPGLQIFDQGRELAALVRHLKRLETDRLGLVLNGDIVDFLAASPATYLDTDGALAKLERSFGDPAFAPVWKALQEFVHSAGRRLVLVLGNHDVELALPDVRERLTHELCGADEAARGRMIYATEGDGFSCRVGGRQVLCLHGNEVDSWNVVDYKALLDTRRALNRRQPVPEWSPNAGTKLVVDLMNPVKREFPFVDLLKPETRAVPAVLAALKPNLVSELARFGPIAGHLVRDAVKRSLGFLGDPDLQEAPSEEKGDQALKELLGTGLDLDALPDGSSVDDLLDRADRLALTIEAEGGSAEQFGADDTAGMLGLPGMIIDHLMGRPAVENLRETLSNWLGAEDSFGIGTEDGCYRRLNEAVGDDIDFLVAGHTHLERAIRRPGGGAYFNSGTWIRLIQIAPESLASAASFRKLYDRLAAGTMQALDEPAGLVLRKPTVVSIVDDDGSVYGELRHVTLSERGRVRLVPVAGSRQERTP